MASCPFSCHISLTNSMLRSILADVSSIFLLPLATFELPQLCSTVGLSSEGVTKNICTTTVDSNFKWKLDSFPPYFYVPL